jgi:hypothetical protein
VILDHPHKDDALRHAPRRAAQQGIRQAKGEAGATTASDQDDSLKGRRVGNGAIRPFDGRLERHPRVLRRKLVQISGKAVVRSNHELERVGRSKSEGMCFKQPKPGNPQEAVLPGMSTQGRLGQRHARTSVGQWRKRGRVAAVHHESNESNNTIQPPHGAGNDGAVYNLLGQQRLMQAEGNNGHDPEADVQVVEELIPPAADEDGSQCEQHPAAPRDDSINIIQVEHFLAVVDAAKVGRVAGRVDDEMRDGGIARDAVKAVEPFVRPRRQEGEGRVLEREEDDVSLWSWCITA